MKTEALAFSFWIYVKPYQVKSKLNPGLQP